MPIHVLLNDQKPHILIKQQNLDDQTIATKLEFITNNLSPQSGVG